MATVKSPTHTIVIFLRELIEEESHCPKLAVLGKLADTVHEIQKKAYVLLVMPGDALRHGISSHDFGFACHCQGSAHANPMAALLHSQARIIHILDTLLAEKGLSTCSIPGLLASTPDATGVSSIGVILQDLMGSKVVPIITGNPIQCSPESFLGNRSELKVWTLTSLDTSLKQLSPTKRLDVLPHKDAAIKSEYEDLRVV